ncbi:hypothetical protein EJF36_05445 [Bacillus sp. HMF5848]|uniref:FixH family protein n=1 Tax=Bacillus sp. HMF5848 TaxID=2495421 RepID=UPI000F7B63B2|nr:FixH family protein [Bacillus sp. HMF5848]RSK26347.1 hypothetical protein EJF36_05445 [Bacillus sp. HMF5848]
MGRKLFMLSFIFIVMLMTGCSSNTDESLTDIAFPEVEFSMSADTVKAGEDITFTTTITLSGKRINADDFEYEIWHEENEEGNHDTIPLENKEKGVYELTKSFDKPGTYYIYYHANAESLHFMNKYSFTVTE